MVDEGGDITVRVDGRVNDAANSEVRCTALADGVKDVHLGRAGNPSELGLGRVTPSSSDGGIRVGAGCSVLVGRGFSLRCRWWRVRG